MVLLHEVVYFFSLQIIVALTLLAEHPTFIDDQSADYFLCSYQLLSIKLLQFHRAETLMKIINRVSAKPRGKKRKVSHLTENQKKPNNSWT